MYSLKRVGGGDEAGRAAVIGPLVLAIAVYDDEGRKTIKELGVRDSKQLSPRQREELEPHIKKAAVEWEVMTVSASDIDRRRLIESLNAMEARDTVALIGQLKSHPDSIIIDATDSIAENYRHRILHLLAETNVKHQPTRIIAEHKADANYLEVSAASVIAKVERDRAIKELAKQYGDIGSGYPADEKTIAFLKQLKAKGEYPPFVRKSWETIEKIKQTALSDF
ncbi:Ribonuclease HII [uncultured archaeon]|nr:Ribonuclease HII [uncultured archaeon]